MKSTYLALILLAFCMTSPALAVDKPQAAFHQIGNWQLMGAGPHWLDLGLGVFDGTGKRGGKSSEAARLELRIGKKLGFIGPAIGLLANTDGGLFGYGGIYADIVYKKLVITPLLAVGGCDSGDGKDLGGTFQFRSSLTLAWQCANRARLGLQVAHISNADLHENNPGEEDYLISLAWSF